MVAATTTLRIIPASALAGRGGLVQFTVDDVCTMIRQGMVAEDASAELLDGFIVHTDRSQFGGDPTTHSPSHRNAVRRLTALVSRIDNSERHVQIQSPVVCGPFQMPEPDFAVIRGNDDDYADRLPTADDVWCIAEVADSSLERDRAEKLPIYAAAGIRQYIILNLRDRTAEVYLGPDSAGKYTSSAKVTPGEMISFQIGQIETIVVPLAELLP